MDGENLKSKFKTFIDKTKNSTRTSNLDNGGSQEIMSSDNIALAAAERDRRSRKAMGNVHCVTHPIPLSELEEDEVLKTLEKEYYERDFDSSSHELKRFTDVSKLDQVGIDVQRQRLLRQLKVVTKRAYARILEVRPQCTLEMENVTHLTAKLHDTLQACRSGRNGLSRARIQFTGSSLGILSAYKRRQRAAVLVHDLSIISTLQRTDERLQELLEAENYPEAIQLLLEGQQCISTYKHFTSIQQLAVKLQDTLELTEEQLDVALSKVCNDFNRESYGRIIKAYELLGSSKMHCSMNQLQMHFASAVHNTAWNKVYGHAVLSQQLSAPMTVSETSQSNSSYIAPGGGVQCRAEDLSKRLYSDICGKVASSSLLPCILDLCRALWSIMDSYKKVVEYHRADNNKLEIRENGKVLEKHGSSEENNLDRSESSDSKVIGEECSKDDERDLMRQDIQRKLETGSTRIWQDVQTKVGLLVVGSNVSELTIDQFLKLLDVIHRLLEVGTKFCNSLSPNSASIATSSLQESLKKQCWAYFYSYHCDRLEDLKMHLENEGWAICPVRQSFNIFQLQEFRYVKECSNNSDRKSCNSNTSSPRKDAKDQSLHDSDSHSRPQNDASLQDITTALPTFDMTQDVNNDSESEENLFVPSQKHYQEYMKDGVITSGEEKNHQVDVFATENPMDDENSDEDVPEELKREFVDEEDEFSSVYDTVSGTPNHTSTPRRHSRISKQNQRRFQTQASLSKGSDFPVMTNASLMLLRLCGKYLHLMQRLQPIAYDVFVAMTQLLEYYFINVHNFFTRDLKESHQLISSLRYSSLLQRIENTLTQPKDNPHVQNINASINANTTLNKSNFEASPTKSSSMNINTSQRLSIPCTPTKNLVININTGRPEKIGSMSLINTPRKEPDLHPNDSISNGQEVIYQNEAERRFSTSSNTFNRPTTLGALPQCSFSVQVRLPSMDQMAKNIDGLTSSDSLFGLAERTISTESVVYLIKQFQKMKRLILKSIPQDENDIYSSIDDYYQQTIEVMEEIRRPVLMVVAERSVSSDVTLQLMSKVSWDIREVEVRSMHNQYVDILLRELQIFSMRLQEIHLKTSEANAQFMTQNEAFNASRNMLWELISLAAAFIFVEGFANAKKCSNEGRALMQLDYRQFVMKLEKTSEQKPLPHQEYVTQYVKAYYIPESDLENWVKYHTEYSPKQLMALVNCVAYSNNKTKQKLNSLINDLSGKIRSKT